MLMNGIGIGFESHPNDGSAAHTHSPAPIPHQTAENIYQLENSANIFSVFESGGAGPIKHSQKLKLMKRQPANCGNLKLELSGSVTTKIFPPPARNQCEDAREVERESEAKISSRNFN